MTLRLDLLATDSTLFALCDETLSNIFWFEQGMYRDRKLNSMQHSVATLRKLCTRYQIYKDKNPTLVPC